MGIGMGTGRRAIGGRNGRDELARQGGARRRSAAALVVLWLAGATAPNAVAQPAALPPPPPQWKAVLVAGDDSSPAFDNGVDALARLLAAQGVATMRALTASHKRFGPERTWATRANLATALAGISPEPGDGCIVYMTSHGEERGLYLARDAGGLLTPDALAAMLDSACRALPTIVVVSACHSGTFLKPSLARDSRIVLTAARADRASFGCSPSDELTFYDRCFLMSYPLSDGWSGLHRDVARCVGAAEQRLQGIEPSEPQAFFGKAVQSLPLPSLRPGGQ